MVTRFVIRNLRKRPLLNIIKVAGLALGLNGILFIALFLKNELSYDAYHEKADRIFRFTTTDQRFLNNNHFARVYNSEQLPDLAAHFPEIENYVRLAPMKGGILKHGEKYYSINQAFVCDSTFFELFAAELILGNRESVLDMPGSMVVSESFAQRVFGKENPVGETVERPAGQFYGEPAQFTIRGVMKDFPQNSHFHPDLIASSSEGPINWWAYCYLLLNENSNVTKITEGYTDFLARQFDIPVDEVQTKAHLQKITDIHLHSGKLREIEANGNMTNIYVLSIAAIILLLISVSNFASLNLGMAGFNTPFIAVNRILGATRSMNFKYFAIESFFIVAVALMLTIIVAVPLNLYISRQFGFNLFESNALFIAGVAALFCLISFLTGLQPIVNQTINTLYHTRRSKPTKTTTPLTNRWIIVSQYTFAIVLIASVLTISLQTNYSLNHSMGVKEDNVICFESVHASIQQKFPLFKEELLKHNSIEAVSAMLEPPGGEANDMFRFEMEGMEPTEDDSRNLIGVFPCDHSFASLFKLNFLSGNNFSATNTDVEGSGEYIVNKTAMRHLNYTDPDEIVGKNFRLIFSSPGIEIPAGKITGVVEDFHLSNMKKKVKPLVMFKRDGLWLINFVVSHKPGMKQTALADMQQVWDELFPAYPFKYEHVSTMYQQVYKTELLQARLLSIFTLIALFICSIGLLGMSLLATQQRVKEIGIRKVNGAQISEILTLLNKRYLKWVTIAFVIATPIAYYAMNKWLQNFAYKTELSWWIFLLAGVLALGIALLTVSWQSWKAANRNPVESLRDE